MFLTISRRKKKNPILKKKSILNFYFTLLAVSQGCDWKVVYTQDILWCILRTFIPRHSRGYILKTCRCTNYLPGYTLRISPGVYWACSSAYPGIYLGMYAIRTYTRLCTPGMPGYIPGYILRKIPGYILGTYPDL